MKVLVVDDHGLFRHGLEMLLSSNLNIDQICHANTGQEALSLQQKEGDLDLVLLDYHLGEEDGLNVLHKLKSVDPSIPVAMISGRDDPQVILSALGSGASGFIQKNLAPDEIVSAIKVVLDGGMYVPPTVIRNANKNQSQNQQESIQKQLHHLAEIARRIIREKNLSVKNQDDIENEMTSALNNLLLELQHDRTRLEVLAFQDDLTGVANRRLFLERLEQALRNCRRKHTQLALVYLDLDYFKEVNDQLGHQAGDTLLKTVADRLTHEVREVDTVARLGGDEFTLVLVDIDSADSLNKQLERLKEALKQPVDLGTEKDWIPSASIGAVISDGTQSGEEVMRLADEALYEVKKQGRDDYFITGYHDS